MEKVLFVASLTPFAKGGGAQATLSYLDATLDIFGRDNVVVMIAEEAIIPKDYDDIHYIKIGKRNGVNKYKEFLTGYYSRFTIPLMQYVDSHDKFDYCIINGGVPAGKAVPYIEKKHIKTVVIHHNYEVEFHRDNKTIESLHGKYLGGIRSAEKTAYRTASINLFLTNQDVELFQKNYGSCRGKRKVLGCFDMKQSEVVNLSDVEKQYDIVISGSLATYQTTVGIRDFNDNYLELAKHRLGKTKVLLTGRNPSEEIQKIQSSNQDIYTIIPNPVEILPVVQSGRIYVCPTCIGGGLKLRAMDGLKCGLPVLVHEVSARGYDYFIDKPYFRVYNDTTSFDKGLGDLISFLKDTVDPSAEINSDYYEYFGYRTGVKRMSEALHS